MKVVLGQDEPMIKVPLTVALSTMRLHVSSTWPRTDLKGRWGASAPCIDATPLEKGVDGGGKGRMNKNKREK
jgi:hypothetical protein